MRDIFFCEERSISFCLNTNRSFFLFFIEILITFIQKEIIIKMKICIFKDIYFSYTKEVTFMDEAKRKFDEINDKILMHAGKFNIDLRKGELWYRGESKIYETISSSLMRQLPIKSLKTMEPVIGRIIMNYEGWIYKKFSNELSDKFPDIYKNITENSWDIVFYMQHYGVPTRFIDWTQDLNTALFFATEKARSTDDNTVLWLFAPLEFNKKIHNQKWLKHPGNDDSYEDFIFAEERGLEQKNGVAISPHGLTRFASKDIERMYSQYGHFVFIPKIFSGMNEYIDKLSGGSDYLKNTILTKIDISNSDARLINKHLVSIGCDRARYKLDQESPIDSSDYTFKKFQDTY